MVISSKKVAIWIAFIALVIVAFFIVRPYIVIILAAAVLAFILYKPYKWLRKLIKSKNAASAIICVVVVLALAVIIYFVAQSAIKEAFNLYLSIQKLDSYQVIESFVSKFFASPDLAAQITSSIQRGITTITNQFISGVGDVISDIPKIIFQLFILIFVTFYFLKEGKKIVGYVREILPFDPKTNEKFIKRSENMTSATVFGMVIVGIIQGIIAGVGFYLFHAPSPLFFTILCIFLGILPFIGPYLVWAPVGLAMIASGSTVNGILLMAFGLIVVSTIDNIIRPLIVGKRGKVNPALALIGMLGGLALMGPIGIIIGPILLEYLTLFFFIYKERKKGKNGKTKEKLVLKKK